MNNNKYNLHLEALRGIAAILVFLTHLTGPVFFFRLNNSYLLRSIGAWGTEAVILFFVLSGIVIHASFDKVPRSNSGFLANRIIRLHPILIVTILFTVLVDKLIINHPVSTWQVIGNIIPVSTFSGALAKLYMDSNPVIWSLSFEMFFYVMFAVGGIYKRKINQKFLNAWFILSIAGIIAYYNITSTVPVVNYLLLMMSFSCIWLIGFFIWYVQKKYVITIFSAVLSMCCLPLISRLHITANYYDPVKYLLFAIASIPFFAYLCQLDGNYKKDRIKGTLWLCITLSCLLFSAALLIMDNSYKNTVKYIYIFLPFIAFLFYNNSLKKLAKKIYYSVILLPFSFIGTLSYSIYLVHFPILVVINQLSMPIYLKIVLSIVVVFAVSLFSEYYFQPFVKGLFKKKIYKLTSS